MGPTRSKNCCHSLSLNWKLPECWDRVLDNERACNKASSVGVVRFSNKPSQPFSGKISFYILIKNAPKVSATFSYSPSNYYDIICMVVYSKLYSQNQWARFPQSSLIHRPAVALREKPASTRHFCVLPRPIQPHCLGRNTVDILGEASFQFGLHFKVNSSLNF